MGGSDMLVTREICLDDYFGLVKSFERGWLYHDKSWLLTVRDGFGAEVVALLTENRGGEAIALTPLMRIRKGPFKLVGSPLRGMYTEFAGPLFAAGLDEVTRRKALVSQHAYIRHQGAGYVEWGCKGGAMGGCMEVLCDYGYDYVPQQTLVMDLGCGSDKVWNGFTGRARNTVRKAEKNSLVTCEIVPNEADMQHYYAMLTETFRRQGLFPPHPFSFFRAACNHLTPLGYMKLIQARTDDRVVAGAIFLCFSERMMYLSGVSNDEGARLAANSLIQWVAMRRAINSGLTEYDLGGVGNAKIDKFKESFGGRPLTHHRWIYRAWPVKLAETSYGWLAKRGWVRLHG